MGTPSPREGGAGKWLPEFMEAAKAQKLRIDFVCVHWYDRKGVRKKANATTAQRSRSLSRFKAYMTKIHDQYGLPIWITEWNANPGRKTPVQRTFMKMALEWMDKTPWMERYSWFQPIPIPSPEYREAIALDTKGGQESTKHELKMTHPGQGDFIIKPHFDPKKPLTELGKYWSNFKSAPSMAKDVYLGKNNLCEDEVEEGIESVQ